MLAIVWLARRWSLSAVANAEPTSEGKVSCLFALSTTMPRLFVPRLIVRWAFAKSRHWAYGLFPR
jgi:hypothetical protein